MHKYLSVIDVVTISLRRVTGKITFQWGCPRLYRRWVIAYFFAVAGDNSRLRAASGRFGSGNRVRLKLA